MTPEQRFTLRRVAEERDLSVQELLELTVFHELRPRQRARRRTKFPQAEELPIAG